MTKDEALEILQNIQEMYPSFGLTKRKAIILIPNMLEMEYSGVMKNLSTYAMKYPNPPMLDTIAAYPREEDEALKKIKQWNEEAKKVPQHVRDEFAVKFKALLKKLEGERDANI